MRKHALKILLNHLDYTRGGFGSATDFFLPLPVPNRKFPVCHFSVPIPSRLPILPKFRYPDFIGRFRSVMGLPKIAEEEVAGCPDRRNKTRIRRREEELKKPRRRKNLEKGDGGVGGRKNREDSGGVEEAQKKQIKGKSGVGEREREELMKTRRIKKKKEKSDDQRERESRSEK